MVAGQLLAVPELAAEGPARLIEQQGELSRLVFLATGAEMTQETRRCVRYPLLPGTVVRWRREGEDAQRGTILAMPPRPKDGRLLYGVGTDAGKQAIDESWITLVEEPDDPFERLATVHFHDLVPVGGRGGGHKMPLPLGPRLFAARERLLAWRGEAWQRSGGVVALAGARIEPLPHQIRAAQRALHAPQVRVLLADEVGLGKTIEAGLIMQTLQAAKPDLRAVVVAPGALLGQWLMELHVRFGGRTALMLDEERLASFKGDPWDHELVLISAQALENLPSKHAIRFNAARWDVAVVDECHRMSPGGRLYKQIKVLSKRSRHVMLLSATPDRRHAGAYAGLLGLLRPASAPEVGEVAILLAEQDRLEALCERTRCGEDWSQLEPAWRDLLADDPDRDQILAAGKSGDIDGLMLHVARTHRLDVDIIRHRRAELAALAHRSGVKGLTLASRVCRHVAYDQDEPESHIALALRDYVTSCAEAYRDPPVRLLHWLSTLIQASWSHPDVLVELLALRLGEMDKIPKPARGDADIGVLLRGDGSPSEQKATLRESATQHVDPSLEEALLDELAAAAKARADGDIPARSRAAAHALTTFWEDHPREKVLVFVQSTDAVHGVAADLADLTRVTVLTFGAHQDQEEREQVVRRFREDDRVSVLVCDALGGEGRNFQFVSLVMHYDLPWSPATVEQRIGRVDRLGRDGEVPSVVLQARDGCDAAWAQILDRAVEVFRRSSAGLEFVLDDIAEQAVRGAVGDWSAGILHAEAACCDLVAGERQADAERSERRLSHEADAFAEATRLAAAAADIHLPIGALADWLRGMGGRLRRDHDDERLWHLRLPRDSVPTTGVMEREVALVRPDLSYYAPGQYQIEEILAHAVQARWCDAGGWRRAAGEGVRQWEGVRVACALCPDWMAMAANDVPLAAWRLLSDCWNERRQVCWMRLEDRAVEDDPAILAHLAKPFGKVDGDVALSNDSSRGFWLKALSSREHFPQLCQWQQRVRDARPAVEAWAEGHTEHLLAPAREAARRRLQDIQREATVRAHSASGRLGADHPDARRLITEAEDLQRQAVGLMGAIEGARLIPESAAYVVVA
jgi:ATP-dependent helicase HepA